MQQRKGTVRFALAGCPKCGGDLALECDTWGERCVCLQCGREEPVPLSAASRVVSASVVPGGARPSGRAA